MTSPPMAIGAERLEAEHGRGGGGQEGRAGRQAGDEHCASGVVPGPHEPVARVPEISGASCALCLYAPMYSRTR